MIIKDLSITEDGYESLIYVPSRKRTIFLTSMWNVEGEKFYKFYITFPDIIFYANTKYDFWSHTEPQDQQSLIPIVVCGHELFSIYLPNMYVGRCCLNKAFHMPVEMVNSFWNTYFTTTSIAAEEYWISNLELYEKKGVDLAKIHQQNLSHNLQLRCLEFNKEVKNERY